MMVQLFVWMTLVLFWMTSYLWRKFGQTQHPLRNMSSMCDQLIQIGNSISWISSNPFLFINFTVTLSCTISDFLAQIVIFFFFFWFSKDDFQTKRSLLCYEYIIYTLFHEYLPNWFCISFNNCFDTSILVFILIKIRINCTNHP